MSAEFPAPDNPPVDDRTRRRLLLKDLFRVAGVTLFFVVVALVLHHESVRSSFDIHRLRGVLNPPGTLLERWEGFAFFVLLFGFLIAIGFPRVWASAIAGTIYGAVVGASLALVASLAGAMGTWMLGKSLFQSMVRRRLGARLEPWRRRLADNPFLGTLYLRLLPATNATLNGLLCGACGVRPLPYLAGNAVGFIPLTIVFASLGSGAAKEKPLQILLGSVLFLLVVLVQLGYRRRVKQRLRGFEPAPDKTESPST